VPGLPAHLRRIKPAPCPPLAAISNKNQGMTADALDDKAHFVAARLAYYRRRRSDKCWIPISRSTGGEYLGCNCSAQPLAHEHRE
jgi:hypothetical protein